MDRSTTAPHPPAAVSSHLRRLLHQRRHNARSNRVPTNLPRVPTIPAAHHLPTVAVITASTSSSSPSRSPDDIAPVPPALLAAAASPSALEEDAEYLGNMVRCWLDDEWMELDAHKHIGRRLTGIYLELRPDHELPVEMGDIVLGLSQGLLSSMELFQEAFVGPFDVANKAAELLMLRSGCEVCCVSDADKASMVRYEAQLAEEKMRDSM